MRNMFKQVKNSKNSILLIAASNAIRSGLRETQTLISLKTSNFGIRVRLCRRRRFTDNATLLEPSKVKMPRITGFLTPRPLPHNVIPTFNQGRSCLDNRPVRS